MIVSFHRTLLSISDEGRGAFDVEPRALADELVAAVPGRLFRIRCDGEQGEVIFSDDDLSGSEQSACAHCIDSHKQAAAAS